MITVVRKQIKTLNLNLKYKAQVLKAVILGTASFSALWYLGTAGEVLGGCH